MADPDLKSIPTKVLKTVVRKGNLSPLISSDEGRIYFQSYLSQYRPEINKYWAFYNSVDEIFSNPENQEQKLVSLEECFDKHIARGAGSQNRVDDCLEDKTVVENLKKALREKDSESLFSTFKELQQSAFNCLNEKVFSKLIPKIDSEYSSRKKYCDLS